MTDSKESTDSFRAQMPTNPDEILAQRLNRIERKQAIQDERQLTRQRVQSEMRQEMKEGFLGLGARMDIMMSAQVTEREARNRADFDHELLMVRADEKQAALTREVRSVGGKAGALTGAGTTGIIVGIVELLKLIFGSGPPPGH